MIIVKAYAGSEFEKIIHNLPPRERNIMELSLGIHEEPKTLNQIGELMFRTGGAISVVRKMTMRKLMHPSRIQIVHEALNSMFDHPSALKLCTTFNKLVQQSSTI